MSAETFDGSTLYLAALKAVSRHHRKLLDFARNEQFLALWQNRFSAQELERPDDAHLAINEMLNSLGERFDYFLDEEESVRYLAAASSDEPVVHSRYVCHGVSRIRLESFTGKATSQMFTALKEAAKGDGLILDLRHNPGGDQQILLDILSAFIETGTIAKLISRHRAGALNETITLLESAVMTSSTPNRFSTPIRYEHRSPLLLPPDMPLAVLVDQCSASASEILAFTLQHFNRAVVLGQRSRGKSVGQLCVDLPYGRKIGITYCEWLPAGHRLDGIGVLPDIELHDLSPQEEVLAAEEWLRPLISRGKNRRLRRAQIEEQLAV